MIAFRIHKKWGLTLSILIILFANSCSFRAAHHVDDKITISEKMVYELGRKIDKATQERQPAEILKYLAPDFRMQTHYQCGEETIKNRVEYEGMSRVN